MLNLFRRHSNKCPHRHKGRDYIKCSCLIHVDGILESGERYRDSLKTRDWGRAKRKLAEIEGDGVPPPKPPKPPSKTLAEAVQDFLARYTEGSDTHRKYKRMLAHLTEYCTTKSISDLTIEVNGKEQDAIKIETMDDYETWRNTKKDGWSWTKEIEVLRGFFRYCVDRDWMRKNPAKALKRPRLLEANHC